jgi:phage-related protein
MAPTLGDYQLQFGDSGVLLNGDAGSTPFVDVTGVSGLDSATYRTSKKDTEGFDGAVIEAEFESSRTITVSGTIYGITHALMEAYVDSLKANFAPSKDYQPLYFKVPGRMQRMAFAKCTSGLRSNWDPMRRLAIATFSATFECGDPIIYGIDELQLSGSLETQDIPGFEFPFEFPFNFGTVAPSVTGGILVTPGGNRPAPFVITFTGTGVTNPGLLHEGLSKQVQFNITLGVGDQLVVDFRKRSVMFNNSPRRGKVTREGWFLLQQGVTNSLRLTASTGSLQATISTRDAWR